MSRLVSFLSAATGLTEPDVQRIIARAPDSYKHYLIDKRRGGKRLISQPAKEVKALQRVLAQRLGHLRIHDAATAYRVGYSIKQNAERHAANGPILKYDFEDFFHSILARDWLVYCREYAIFSEFEDVLMSARLFFHRRPGSDKLRLAIGAPSSPWLSNVLMYEFDERITEIVAKDKVTYTRYADDLTFSARRTGYLTVVDRALRKLIKEMDSPSLKINEEKTLLATTKYRRVVTGLVLADDGRVTIGRDRKRIIRARVHHALKGINTAEDNARLAGLLSFVQDIEPGYITRLNETYGVDVMHMLRSNEIPISNQSIIDIGDI